MIEIIYVDRWKKRSNFDREGNAKIMEKILLFIPMYNCESQIPRVLKQMDNEILEYISEILIVNNRSVDNGEQAVIDFANQKLSVPIKLYRNKENYGGGGSHKIAFNYAIDHGYDYIIVLHGDDQGDIHDLLPYLKSGEAFKYDSFLGSRFEQESKLINYSKFRIIGNHVFNLFMTMCLGRKITDLGSGLNMYSISYLKDKFYMSFINNLTFYVYMLIYGVASGSRFKFFPLSWREEDQISNAKFFKQARQIFAITINYVLNKKSIFVKDNIYSEIEYDSEEIFTNIRTRRK